MIHKKRRYKYKSIVIRGCVMKVLASEAWKFEREERKLIQNDWAANKVD